MILSLDGRGEFELRSGMDEAKRRAVGLFQWFL